MLFKNVNAQIQKQFERMCTTGMLFRVNISGNELWEKYLSSFEEDPIFRDPQSSTHNCNNCKNFIRRYGNIVAIMDIGGIESIFSNVEGMEEYQPSIEALDILIRSKKIKDVFFESYDMLNSKLNYESCKKDQETYKLGIAKNHKQYSKEEVALYPEVVVERKVYEFNHFSVNLPKAFVNFSNRSIEAIIASYRDKKSVFERAMKEIPLDTLNLVKDLISQGSLLDGTAHLNSIQFMIDHKKKWALINDKDSWYWTITYSMHEAPAKFKNTLIGVLCTELAEGVEINKACENWNKRVDPVNYHKATAPITKTQINMAKEFVIENGFEESFKRRLAIIADIKAEEIKHMNIDNETIKEVSVFDNVKATSTQHKRSEFKNIEEVSIDKFIKDILPQCSSIEAFLLNSHEGNLVTLTTSEILNSKPIFKWSNNFSWTFNGNLAGKSQIKESVKSQGGKVDGVLRFSIMWAEDLIDNSDLDAHCIEPGGNVIYYSNPNSRITNGNLDIDITQPQDHKRRTIQNVVENITYPSISSMINGYYHFKVHQYAARNSKGFKAEIEFDGNIYSYEYNQPVKGKIEVATVNLKNGIFTIEHHLTEKTSSKELWGLDTNQSHKVELLCTSPNHWGENKVGNLHYFFMLKDCKPNTDIRGFHNENLIPELLKHRKVMEVLGLSNMITPKSSQLAGIGFNSTVRDELVVKCSGTFRRVLKIKF